MSFNVGVNVVEVDGRAAPSIQAAPTSQTGFVVRSDRGLPAAVRRITSFKQFTQQFGGYRADAFGAYALRGAGLRQRRHRRLRDPRGPRRRERRRGRRIEHVHGRRGRRARRDGGRTRAADLGAWGNRLGIRIAANEVVADTYDLFVRLDGRDVER